MFSFAKIATFAVLAFGALASALPSPVASPDVKAIVARQDASDVTGILTNLASDLQAPVAQMNALTPENTTPATVTPILVDIQVLITAAVSACSGKSAGSGDLIVLLSVIINLVIGACGKVCGFPTIDISIQVLVVAYLDVCLSALISVVLGLVGGILTVVIGLLVGLLGAVVEIILSLKLVLCIKVLALVSL